MTTIATRPALAEPFLFREKKETPAPAPPSPEPEDSQDAAAEEAILCAACRAPVTSARHAISLSGAHRHTFFNPAGIVYEIRCFKRASGTMIHGEPTGEFSWFAGYEWQYCLCAACLEHLGWLFTATGDMFYGLIASRLITGEQGG